MTSKLRPAAVVILLAAATGCASDPVAPEATTAAAAAAPAAMPAVTIPPGDPAAIPDVDATEYFEGSAPGTFGSKMQKLLPNGNRVAVAGFRMVYIVENSATAKVDSVYLPGGVERTAARAKMTVRLQGVDGATMQAITDKAYATFIRQLSAAGREVVPLEAIKPLYSKLDLTESTPDKPYTKNLNGRIGVAFSPTGMPLWWTSGDAFGNVGFSQKNMRTIPEFSKEINAWVISPMIVVDFASMSSSGNRSGLMARRAEVGASLAVAVHQIWMQLTRAEDTKFGLLSDGDEGFLKMTKGVAVESPFAEMQEVSSDSTDRWTALWVGSSSARGVKAAVSDNARYAAAAEEVTAKATGLLARFFQQHPAK